MMELESEEGAKISIENESTTELGRDLGLGVRPFSTDRTVSRRHLSLQSTTDPNSPNPRISFEVIGKNPVLVHTDSGGGGEKIYRNSERGELRVGDKFTLSLKTPSFFVVKAREEEEEEAEERRGVLDAVERREKRTLERRREKKEEGVEEEFELDISEIDPVKEFGFLVKGREFDPYPKINLKHWNWFLDEPGKKGDEDDDEDDDEDTRSKGKRCGKRKMKNCDVEEEWSGESENDEVLMKGGSSKRPTYSTRSRDPKNPRKDVKTRKDEVEEEDETTLGGFIVSEEVEEEETEEGESEDEFEEEEEDEDE